MAKYNKVTFSNSNAAQADTYSTNDSYADGIIYLSVLTGDPASATLYSIGSTNTSMMVLAGNVFVPTDLTTDTVVGVNYQSTLGAAIFMTATGQVGYDMRPISATIDSLAPGRVLVDTFYYAIQMGNGTVSWNTVTVNIIGKAANIGVFQEAGLVTEASNWQSPPNNPNDTLTDAGAIVALAASGNLTTIAVTPASGDRGALTLDPAGATYDSAIGGLAYHYDYSVPEQTVYNTNKGYGELAFTDSWTIKTANGTTTTFSENVYGNIHAPVLTAAAGASSITQGGSVGLNISATDHDDNASLSYKITGVPANASLSNNAGMLTANSDSSYTLTSSQLAGLTLSPNSAFTGMVNLAVTATNTEGAAQLSSAPQDITITITGSNESPLVIEVPAAQTIADDTGAAIIGVSLSETGNSAGKTFTVTLSDTTGQLSVSGTGGSVSGSGTNQLTITGSLGLVKSYLSTLVDSDTIAGSDTITLNATDSFGSSAAPQTIAVTVDGPVSGVGINTQGMTNDGLINGATIALYDIGSVINDAGGVIINSSIGLQFSYFGVQPYDLQNAGMITTTNINVGTILNTGTIAMSGQTISSYYRGIVNDGTVIGYGTLGGHNGPIYKNVNDGNGIFEAFGGRLDIQGGLPGDLPGLEIANASNAILQIDGTTSYGDIITFLGGAGTLDLPNSAAFYQQWGPFQSIAGLTPSIDGVLTDTNEIDLSGVAASTITSASVSGTTIGVNTTGGSFGLGLTSAVAAGTDVLAVSDGGNGTDLFLTNRPGTVYGAPGETIIGGSGPLTFAFEGGFGQDTVVNFLPSNDVLQFNTSLLRDYATAMFDAHQVGADTVITIDPTHSVTLQNTNLSSLTTNNFLFG
jgi:hypothetical protein